jgi:hypothetical protein
MLGAVTCIRNIVECGLWFLARGLYKPTFLILLALTYDAYTTPRFSFSKFNQMLVGETSGISNHQTKTR